MPKILNNRRRFLGLLALLGAPGLARAQTGDGFYEVVCKEQLAGGPGFAAAYYRHFYLENGRLAPKITGDYNTAIVTPANAQYSEGYGDAAVTAGGQSIATDAIQLKVVAPTSDSVKLTFTASIRVPEAITQCSVNLLTSAGEMNTTGGTAPASAADPNVREISAEWWPAPKEAIAGPVQIGVSFNNAYHAIFDFDFSARKVLDTFQAHDDDLLTRTGLSLNTTTNVVTGAETCAYDPNAASDAACFFTTAAVGTLGLSDDCWELRTLRAFRDGPLAETPNGRALAARYYAEAPRLVAGVNRRPDAARVWLAHYWSHVLPCAVLARVGLDGMAVAHYRDLFARLERLAA